MGRWYLISVHIIALNRNSHQYISSETSTGNTLLGTALLFPVNINLGSAPLQPWEMGIQDLLGRNCRFQYASCSAWCEGIIQEQECSWDGVISKILLPAAAPLPLSVEAHPHITPLPHFHQQGNPRVIKQNTLPNKRHFSACVCCVCSHNTCLAEKPTPAQHISYTAPITDNFPHAVFALFSLCCIDIEGLVQQVLVSKGKGQ